MSPPDPPRLLVPLWLDDLRRTSVAQADWLWHGYVAPGNTTLLTSQWKAGKTTLLSALLHQMKVGGELAGRRVLAGRAVIVSEEGPEHWLRRSERFDFGTHVCWLCRPFATKPAADDWLRLLDHLLGLRREQGVDLAVIDPLASFMPGQDENSAGTMLNALLPLQRLTTAGMAVLVLHHPRKRSGPEGQASRGSGALLGYVDVLVEMDWYRRSSPTDRRRLLRGWSRHEETPRQLVIEWCENGVEYRACGDVEKAEEDDTRRRLRALLEMAPGEGWTRQEVLDHWPAEERKPDGVTLWRRLEAAVTEGWVKRSGTGRSNSPYRYGLADRKQEGNPTGLPDLPPLEPLEPPGGYKLAKKTLERLMKRREKELEE